MTKFSQNLQKIAHHQSNLLSFVAVFFANHSLRNK